MNVRRGPGLLPAVYMLMGTVLLAIGGKCFVNLNEDPDIFIVLTVLFSAPGLYLIISGAVARGIEMTGLTDR